MNSITEVMPVLVVLLYAQCHCCQGGEIYVVKPVSSFFAVAAVVVVLC